MPEIQSKKNCSLELAHGLIGGKWKVIILWHIIHGENRFSQLKKALPDITEKVLYTNLKELEKSGIIYREVKSEQKPIAVIYNIEKKYCQIETLIDLIYEFTEYYADINKIEV